MPRSKIFVISGFMALALVALGAPEPEELAALRTKFNDAMSRATEGMNLFWPTYRKRLADVKEDARAKGDLESVLAVEAEIKGSERLSIGKGAHYEPLKKLQDSFAGLYRQLNRETLPAKQRLYDIYYAQLQNLEVSLTKQSRLDDALVVRQVGEQVKTEAAANAALAKAALGQGAEGTAPAKSSGPITGDEVATNVVGRNNGGDEYRDVGRDGGILVGFDMVITPFKNSNDTVRGVTPVYLGSKGETKGKTYGTEHGNSVRRILARPGYAIGKVTVQYDDVAIRRMKIGFDRINGSQLSSIDSYESAWVGVYPDAKEDSIDMKGKVPVGIAGRSGFGLNSLGILYVNH